MRCCIDHIAVTAPSLESGAEFIREALGVSPQPGGEHPRMGTHNMLLRLGETVYLEVIAPNPNAERPGRPRWFGLDTLRPDSAPGLGAWVARTEDIYTASTAASERLGEVEAMTRGSLEWHITISADGSLALGGLAPSLIQWKAGEPHPAGRLEDRGLSLVRLELFHPEPERVSRLLRSLEFEGPVSVEEARPGETPYLVAQIRTPLGLRTLSGRHA